MARRERVPAGGGGEQINWRSNTGGNCRLDGLNRPWMRDEAIPKSSRSAFSSRAQKGLVDCRRIVSKMGSLEIRNPFGRDGRGRVDNDDEAIKYRLFCRKFWSCNAVKKDTHIYIHALKHAIIFYLRPFTLIFFIIVIYIYYFL